MGFYLLACCKKGGEDSFDKKGGGSDQHVGPPLGGGGHGAVHPEYRVTGQEHQDGLALGAGLREEYSLELVV